MIEFMISWIYPVGLLIAGYIVGKSIGLIVRFFLRNILGLDKWLEMKQIKLFENKTSLILSNIIKWYIYLFFIGEALIITKIKVLEDIGSSLLGFIPNLFLGIFILILGLLAIEVVSREIVSNLEIEDKYKSLANKAIKFVGLYVILVMVLNQIGIDTTILIYLFIVLFTGIVLALSIAAGIAFGLALREKASEIIEKFLK